MKLIYRLPNGDLVDLSAIYLITDIRYYGRSEKYMFELHTKNSKRGRNNQGIIVIKANTEKEADAIRESIIAAWEETS